MPDAMSEDNLKILANWMIPYLRKTLLYKLETWPKSGSGMRGPGVPGKDQSELFSEF